jgi:DNA-directed RNA polymerase subunit RPC12/RpoP
MDYRCPDCGADLGRRKLGQAVMVRMEIDCTQCKRSIRLNIHRAEMAVVLVDFGLIVLLGAAAYWTQSRAPVLWALAAAALGASALPLLERTWLRDWPRFTSKTADR